MICLYRFEPLLPVVMAVLGENEDGYHSPIQRHSKTQLWLKGVKKSHFNLDSNHPHA